MKRLRPPTRLLATAFLLAAGVLGGIALSRMDENTNADSQTGNSASAITAHAAAPFGDPNVFVSLAKKVVPSVVNIQTSSTIRTQPGGPYGDEFFRRFFEDFLRRHGGGQDPRGGDPEDEEEEGPAPGPGGRRGGPAPKAYSLGTGFIIEESGLILTNNHVVANADEIKIQFSEGDDPIDGEVVGRDPELDLALIKVKTKRKLVPVVLGDSDKLEQGEYVMAVGNPFGQGHSVSHGIISAKNRQSPDFALAKYLQTDAPINPGNSGGPLVNLRGEVIGINNAIDARAQGIGFAIPISSVKAVLPQLKSKGSVARGYIGVLVNPLTPEIAEKVGAPKKLKAPFVAHVYAGQPADKAGIKPYDVILELNGKKIQTPSDLIEGITSIPVGQTAKVKVLRGNDEKSFDVLIGERNMGAKGKEKQEKKKPSKPKVELGMSLDDLTPELARKLGMPESSAGVAVSYIAYGGPADRSGLKVDDVIIEVDQKPVKSVDQFLGIVNAKKSYLVRVRRLDEQGQDVFHVIVLDLKGK